MHKTEKLHITYQYNFLNVLSFSISDKCYNLYIIEQKILEIERRILEQTSERASKLLKEEQEQIKALRSRSTYSEFYNIQGFNLKELGTEIDEEVKKYLYYLPSCTICKL